MSNPKPSIVFVPGAWHRPECFAPLTSILESAGYTCIGVDLPSVGANPPVEGIKEDVAAIRAAVEAQVDADRDVLVFMHSYGSVPGGEAVKGLDKISRRKDGGRGGVSALFYCAAFAPPKGNSLIDMLGGKPLPWFVIDSTEKIVNPATPREIFYDLDTDPEVMDEWISKIAPHSYRTMFGKTSWEPWRTISSTYLFCTADKALPFEIQKAMIGGAGGEWKEASIDASHSPFFSKPEEVALAVRRAAGETV